MPSGTGGCVLLTLNLTGCWGGVLRGPPLATFGLVSVSTLGLGYGISLDPLFQVKLPNDPNDKPPNQFTLKSPFHFIPYMTDHKVLWSLGLRAFIAPVCNSPHFPQIPFILKHTFV